MYVCKVLYCLFNDVYHVREFCTAGRKMKMASGRNTNYYKKNLLFRKIHRSLFSNFTNKLTYIRLGLKINPSNPELNPMSYLLALLAHYFLHVSRIRVKSLTTRLLMSYIYGAPILDVSRSHTTTHHGR